jgi:hypothetical protein
MNLKKGDEYAINGRRHRYEGTNSEGFHIFKNFKGETIVRGPHMLIMEWPAMGRRPMSRGARSVMRRSVMRRSASRRSASRRSASRRSASSLRSVGSTHRRSASRSASLY